MPLLTRANMPLAFLATWAHTGSCSGGSQPEAPGCFPAILFPVCSTACGCCDPRAGLSSLPCGTSYIWAEPTDPASPDPSAGPSYP